MSEFWEINANGVLLFIRADKVRTIECSIRPGYDELYAKIRITIHQSDPVAILCDTQIDYLNVLDQLRRYLGVGDE